MPDSYPIRHDYHAVHSSGVVPIRSKTLIVLHDPEGGTGHTGAENAASWFQNVASGGSTQFCCDDDSIQQTLSIAAVSWGAPYANRQGVHIECWGWAHWSRKEWLKEAAGSLDRCAFLVAYISHICGIPIRTLTDDEVRDGKRGVTTHAQCTRAFHAGTHTDPGRGFPMDVVLKRARAILKTMK